METILSSRQYTDLISRDCERIKISLNQRLRYEHAAVEINLKLRREEFIKEYQSAIARLEESIPKNAYVDEVRFGVLHDADKNFWGDVGRLTVSYAAPETQTNQASP